MIWSFILGGRNLQTGMHIPAVEPDMSRSRAARGTLALHKTLDQGTYPWRAKRR